MTRRRGWRGGRGWRDGVDWDFGGIAKTMIAEFAGAGRCARTGAEGKSGPSTYARPEQGNYLELLKEGTHI